MKIGCLILQVSLPSNTEKILDTLDQSRFNGLAKCAVDSFTSFHPDADMHYVNDANFIEYCEKHFKSFDMVNYIGLVRLALAYDLMLDYNYDKMIILGCDTITCSRMDEFLDNNTDDILVALNYPNQDSTEYVTTPIIEVLPGVYDHGNINADIMCFNNINAIKKLIDLTLEHCDYYLLEQGALNELAWVDKSCSVKIVDFPYPTSKVVYNARSKGVFGTDMIKKGLLAKHGPLDGQIAPTKKFYVKDKKLYTHDHKQIKCFHYEECMGLRPNEEFNELINDFKYHWFNDETVAFFKEECGCSEFFN
jgi:hypothetical protein